MSRKGGPQPKTVAMFARLDAAAESWAPISMLAGMLGDEYGRPDSYACKVIRAWAQSRGTQISVAFAGRTTFYCSRRNAGLDAGVIAAQVWGQLPQKFRDHRPYLRLLELDERLHVILMAAGWFLHGRNDCRLAFNRWAKKAGRQGIERKL